MKKKVLLPGILSILVFTLILIACVSAEDTGMVRIANRSSYPITEHYITGDYQYDHDTRKLIMPGEDYLNDVPTGTYNVDVYYNDTVRHSDYFPVRISEISTVEFTDTGFYYFN
jgi:hypothetical protein